MRGVDDGFRVFERHGRHESGLEVYVEAGEDDTQNEVAGAYEDGDAVVVGRGRLCISTWRRHRGGRFDDVDIPF